MESEPWKYTMIGNEVELLTGFPFQSVNYTNAQDGISLLRGDNIIQGKLRWENVKKWPIYNSDQTLDKYFLRTDDIVVAMDRPWIEAGLKFAAISAYDIPCILVQRVARLRSKPTLDQRFLKYVIGSREFTNHILAVQTGTAVPHISSDQIKEYRFLLPSLPEQQAIAHILGSLDDKIELNRQMNETLESIARALFKSWFVDFDPVRAKMEGRVPYGMDAETAALFPDGFEDSALGEVPRGWKVVKFTDVIVFSRKSIEPNQKSDEVFEHYSIPAFDKGHLPEIEIGWQIKSNKFLVPENAILLSKINPTIQRVWFPLINKNNRRSICSTEFLVILPKGTISTEYLYALFSTHRFQDFFVALTTGTSNSHQRVKPDEMLNMDFLVPTSKIVECFTGIAAPLYRKMQQSLTESQTLVTLRDTLLPKLLSGEIRVGDVEKEVGAVL